MILLGLLGVGWLYGIAEHIGVIPYYKGNLEECWYCP
tara:strand:+ start:259 stop:369 length:111 start_codon:yes stop_codon:yes gene_type:complete